MSASIRNRLLIIAALIALSLWGLRPRKVEQLRTTPDGATVTDTVTHFGPKLGLDLQGGIHLGLELDQSKVVSTDPKRDLQLALTILRKRDAYRKAFDRFDPRKVARYDARKIRALLADEGIVRNRLKVEGAVRNAKAFLEVQREFGSFDAYLWPFVGGSPRINRPRTMRDVPPRTPESDALSKDLKKRGFASYTEKAGTVTRVRVGPFASREEAEKVATRLRDSGMKGVVVPR